MADREVQRRLAAILAADVAGYTRLMEENSEGTVAAWLDAREDVIKPLVADYSGKIVKLTGDGFLVEFPTVQDAVNCAIAMQQGLVPSSLDFRMGINLGDIIDDGEDIHGEGVNIAARLEGLAEPGGIMISGGVYDQVKNRIDADYVDLGLQEVKNVSDPVQAYAIRSLDAKLSVADIPAAVDGFEDQPAIAILPFDNLSGDPEQEYFSDGLTEDLITALSLWRSFPVIARNSNFAYKGQSLDVRKVAEELGARYVVEGSVRKAGNRVRVTAQLINAETGHHLWAERYDRDLEDIFELQDELTGHIAAIVAPELERAELIRSTAKRPLSLDAWEWVQRGTAQLDEYSKQGNVRAREMFDRARELDNTYSRAFAGIAFSYLRDVMMGYSDLSEEIKNKTLENARQAIASDQSDSIAHSALGIALIWAGQQEDAVLSLQRSVELNPSHGYAHGALGNLLDLMGRTEEGISKIEAGLRLNPNAPNISHFYSFLARAYINARRYEDAITMARKGIQQRPDYPIAHYLMAVSLAHLDQCEEARAALNQCEFLQPGFVASREEWQPYPNSASNEHILDGLRKAAWEAQ